MKLQQPTADIIDVARARRDVLLAHGARNIPLVAVDVTDMMGLPRLAD